MGTLECLSRAQRAFPPYTGDLSEKYAQGETTCGGLYTTASLMVLEGEIVYILF